MHIEKLPIPQLDYDEEKEKEEKNTISVADLMSSPEPRTSMLPPGMLPPPSTNTLSLVRDIGDDSLVAPAIGTTSIRPPSPLIPPISSRDEEVTPPALPKIIKPSLVSAFGFSVKDFNEIGDLVTSPARGTTSHVPPKVMTTKLNESTTMKSNESTTLKSNEPTIIKSNKPILLILTPKQLPPPPPENVPIVSIPSAHGTFTTPEERLPEDFMKKLASLRESAERREYAERLAKEQKQQQKQPPPPKKIESKTTAASSRTTTESPYYEGLGLSSSLFSSPEKHDMEIAMYNARLADEQEKQRKIVMNSNKISEMTKEMHVDNNLLDSYLRLIQNAKYAHQNIAADSPPSRIVRPVDPSSPDLHSTLSVAKTPLRAYGERAYDRVVPATRLVKTKRRKKKKKKLQQPPPPPHSIEEEYASTPALPKKRLRLRISNSNEALETFLYAAVGFEAGDVQTMLTSCPALFHMPVSRIRSILQFFSGELHMNRSKIRTTLLKRPHLLCRPLNALRPAILNIRRRVRKGNHPRPPPPVHPPPPKDEEDVEYEKQVLRRRVQSLCARLVQKEKLSFVSDPLSLEDFKRTMISFTLILQTHDPKISSHTYIYIIQVRLRKLFLAFRYKT